MIIYQSNKCKYTLDVLTGNGFSLDIILIQIQNAANVQCLSKAKAVYVYNGSIWAIRYCSYLSKVYYEQPTQSSGISHFRVQDLSPPFAIGGFNIAVRHHELKLGAV